MTENVSESNPGADRLRTVAVMSFVAAILTLASLFAVRRTDIEFAIGISEVLLERMIAVVGLVAAGVLLRTGRRFVGSGLLMGLSAFLALDVVGEIAAPGPSGPVGSPYPIDSYWEQGIFVWARWLGAGVALYGGLSALLVMLRERAARLRLQPLNILLGVAGAGIGVFLASLLGRDPRYYSEFVGEDIRRFRGSVLVVFWIVGMAVPAAAALVSPRTFGSSLAAGWMLGVAGLALSAPISFWNEAGRVVALLPLSVALLVAFTAVRAWLPDRAGGEPWWERPPLARGWQLGGASLALAMVLAATGLSVGTWRRLSSLESSYFPAPDLGGVATDSAGNVYVADGAYGGRVRKVAPDGSVTTIADSGLRRPAGLALETPHSLYVADALRNRVQRINSDGDVVTVAGNGKPGFDGDGRLATEARLNGPHDVAVDGAGNLYIADTFNERIRRVDVRGEISTLAEGFTHPTGVAVDRVGNVYVADGVRVAKVTPDGTVATVAGFAFGELARPSQGRPPAAPSPFETGDGGPATEATLNATDVVADAAGALYLTDSRFGGVRRVTPDGIITTVAGAVPEIGARRKAGAGSDASSVSFFIPSSLTLDTAGSIYVMHAFGMVSKITPDGLVSTVYRP